MSTAPKVAVSGFWREIRLPTRPIGLAVPIVLMLAACSQTGVAPAGSPLPSGQFALPTAQPRDLPSGVVLGCSSTLTPSVLRGNAADPRKAWLVGYDGKRIELIWPEGYTARYAPSLEVLDPTGHAVLEAGDFVDGTCGIGDPGGQLMQPPFLGFQLDCGPIRVDDCTGGRLSSVAKANGWPTRQIDAIGFTSSEGGYVVRFADGTTATGASSVSR
jgi:hypothetical protein